MQETAIQQMSDVDDDAFVMHGGSSENKNDVIFGGHNF
jgi:hypothetical protein